jgi:hypothetical protein
VNGTRVCNIIISTKVGREKGRHRIHESENRIEGKRNRPTERQITALPF